MATNFNIHRVTSLPPTGKNGDLYLLQKPQGRFELYTVAPDGSLVFNKGVTDAQWSRIERLNNTQVTKLEGLDTQEEINAQIQDSADEINSRIDNLQVGYSGTVTTEMSISDLNALDDGIYRAQTSGEYANGLTAKEGFFTTFRKQGDEWTLESEVESQVVADGEIEEGDDKPLGGDTAYNDLFDNGKVMLKSLLLNRGKEYPFKNYYGYSSSSLQRFMKASLDATLYANDIDECNYTISLVAINDSNSGNRIDVVRKPKDGSGFTTYQFRTSGSSINNTEENLAQLNKLTSGNTEVITLIPLDESFKLEYVVKTDEFLDVDQINMYQLPQWSDFVFQESVHRLYEVREISSKVRDINERLPVKFVDSGVSLTREGEAILKSNGQYYSSSGGSASELIPIDRSEDLYVTGRMVANSATIVAYYDADQNYLEPQFESTGEVFVINRGRLEYPDGAVYVAFASYSFPDFKVERSEGDIAAGVDQVDNLQAQVTNVNTEISSLDNRVTELETNPPTKMLKAIQWQIAVEDRKNEFLGEYFRKKEEDPNYTPPVYGVEWMENEENPNNVIRIGDLDLHWISTGLPIQSKIRRCIVKEGVFQYYLNSDNSNFKEDGVTPAVLDGTDGDVMVEIPEFFFRLSEADPDNLLKKIEICEEGVPGFTFSPKYYLSAYQSTVDRDLQKLASVCSVNYSKTTGPIYIENSNNYVETDSSGYPLGIKDVYEIESYSANATRYRGNVNDESLDGEVDPSSDNYSRNNLGRPVANINRKTARDYAENGNSLIQQYDGFKALFYLITVEYATRDLQQEVNNSPDSNGFRQGGLGKGATQYPDYGSYEKYFSPQGGTAVHPNGVTNELGNNSGESYFRIKNVPVESTGSGESVVYERWGDVIMPVNSYRGIEGVYGQLYEIMDNVDVLITGLTYPLKRVEYVYQPNPYLTNDTDDKSTYKHLGSYEFNSSIHVIKNLMWGRGGHIVPIDTGANLYTVHYCAASELTQAWNGNVATKYKYLTGRGRAVSKTLVDLLFFVAVIDVDSNRARTSDTVRFQYFSL